MLRLSIAAAAPGKLARCAREGRRAGKPSLSSLRPYPPSNRPTLVEIVREATWS